MDSPPPAPPRWPAVTAAAAFGFILFLLQFGWDALRPTNLDWLMRGDWGQHLLGWLMFRESPWAFPLGSTPALAHPLGTTVGYTDSLPLLSILFKPFSAWLPVRFQFNGAWLALCFTLQGAAGALVTSAFTPRRVAQALGGMLFALSPVLMARIGHETLCAHFVLLLLLWLALRPRPAAVHQTLVAAGAVVALSASIHPTLWLMTFALAVAVLWRLRRVEGAEWMTLGVAFAGTLITSALVLYALGYIGGGISTGGAGFGGYNADLLALVNPGDFSRVLPRIPTRPGQHEGYGYLGLGVLLLLLIGRRRFGRSLLPVAVVASLLAVFALASVWTFAGHEVLGLRSLYKPFGRLVDPFRSSGRFIWPLHYLVTALAVWGITLRLSQRPRLLVAALAAAVGIQLVELRRDRVDTAPNPAWNALSSPRWAQLAEGRDHLVVYPPLLLAGGGETCPPVEGGHPESLYLSAGYFAYLHHLTVNSAYLARLDGKKAQAYCAQLSDAVEAGRFDERTLYLVAPRFRPQFERAGLVCEDVDGLIGCRVSLAALGAIRHGG